MLEFIVEILGEALIELVFKGIVYVASACIKAIWGLLLWGIGDSRSQARKTQDEVE